MMTEFMWETAPIDIYFADGSTAPSKQEHCTSLYEALRGYAASIVGSDSPFAAGTRMTEKGSETFFVEHHIDSTKIVRVELTPKRARASIANAAMENAISKVANLEDIAPAVWFAYIHKHVDTSLAGTIEKLSESLLYGVEEDKADDFEFNLQNLEASAMACSGPIDGSEKSVPVLDKKVKGPQKIICGTFETFPEEESTSGSNEKGVKRDSVVQYKLESDMIKKYREQLSPEQLVRVPDQRDSHIYGGNEVYMYEVSKKTENDKGDLAVRVFQITGPAAAGKSEAVEQFAANNGLPFYNVVVNESTRFDQLLDSWVPYLAGGSLPTLTSEEKAVNAAMKADTEGRDAVEIAIEALELPSKIDAEFDPDYAWEALGMKGPAPVSQDIISKIEEMALRVVNSLKEKIESASGGTELTLAYKCVPSPLVSWCRTGGVLEIGEMATMRKGEMAKLHDLLDFNRKGSIMTAEGECFRHEACYVFLTNNLEYDEDHPLTLPMISRMSLDVEFPQLSEQEAIERIVSNLGCETKRVQAKDLVHAYVALGKEATSLSLPGGIDFRNLKQIANRILVHDFAPRKVFEKEVIHHFVQHSDPESKAHDESALLSILDELDMFR